MQTGENCGVVILDGGFSLNPGLIMREKHLDWQKEHGCKAVELYEPVHIAFIKAVEDVVRHPFFRDW